VNASARWAGAYDDAATWSLRAKGQTDEIVGGGIAISKK
jgi:hypothetical protein